MLIAVLQHARYTGIDTPFGCKKICYNEKKLENIYILRREMLERILFMSSATQIEKIGFIRLQITMQAPDAAFAESQWLGSTLRGAIGHALVQRCCPEQHFHCENCSAPCSAGLLFASATPNQSEEAVNPFVLDCTEQPWQGGCLCFGLTFFANGLSAVEDTMLALRDGLELGKSKVSLRLMKILDAVTQESLYDGFLLCKPKTHYLQCSEQIYSRYCIEFLTPYRSKLKTEEFGFEQLIRALLRRISTVMKQSGTEPQFDYPTLIAQSQKIRVEYRILNPVGHQRYSSRTHSYWEVTGFTGVMVVSGDMQSLLPLLRMGEVIGAGKLCVMGLGKLKVSAILG